MSQVKPDDERLKERFSYVAYCFKLGRVERVDVVKWADERIQESDLVPEWLIEVSLHCPEAFFDLERLTAIVRPNSEFDFEFNIWSATVRENELMQFASWLAYACLGRDLDDSRVRTGYLVEDRLYDPRQRGVIEADLQSLVHAFPGDRARFRNEFPWKGSDTVGQS